MILLVNTSDNTVGGKLTVIRLVDDNDHAKRHGPYWGGMAVYDHDDAVRAVKDYIAWGDSIRDTTDTTGNHDAT